MDIKLMQIKPMECPICKKFYFSELSDVDIEQLGLTPNTTQCNICGWYYDLERLENHNLENESNIMSFNQYKNWYNEKIRENPKWEYYQDFIGEPEPHLCPLCGEYTFEDSLSYAICPICGWQDTGFEDDPDEKPSEYGMSFNERLKYFTEKRKQNPKYKWKNDKTKN